MSEQRKPDNVRSSSSSKRTSKKEKRGVSFKSKTSLDDDDDARARAREDWKELEAKLRARGATDEQIGSHALAYMKRQRHGMAGASETGFLFQQDDLLGALEQFDVARPDHVLQHHDPDAIWAALEATQAAIMRLDNPGGFVVWQLRGR